MFDIQITKENSVTKSIDCSSLGLPPLPSGSADTITALLWAREVLQKHQATIYAVADPNGIEELKSVNIGGVEQWLHIRGRNKDNPVLLFVHGGPGSPMIGLMDAVQRPWEDYFTVVQWDQRQTGKSYYPADDKNNPLTLDQFIKDSEEVVQYLRDHMNVDKLFLLGHSWGTVLGMHMVKRHPDWLHAYIGVGQTVGALSNARVLYSRLIHHAKNNGEYDLVSKIEKEISLLDSDSPGREESYADNCILVRRELSRLGGEALMRHTFWDDALASFSLDRAISPHLTLTDLSNSIIGDESAFLRSPYVFTEELLNIDLPTDLGLSFDVPIFFFSGKHDWQTATSLSDQWFDSMKAPHKELIRFENSCHYMMNEEPGKVLLSLVNKVLPFANYDSD